MVCKDFQSGSTLAWEARVLPMNYTRMQAEYNTTKTKIQQKIAAQQHSSAFIRKKLFNKAALQSDPG